MADFRFKKYMNGKLKLQSRHFGLKIYAKKSWWVSEKINLLQFAKPHICIISYKTLLVTQNSFHPTHLSFLYKLHRECLYALIRLKCPVYVDVI